MATSQPITLETALKWARSGHESDKVYRYLFIHPDDFFVIPNQRKWPIAHQVIYNGDVDLLKRILSLNFDDQMKIRTLSGDGKTLLDVAKERQIARPEMFKYVEHLFLQDDLIQAASTNNWKLVMEILEKNPQLANEKPPYATYFVLHYIVQNGDHNLLENFLQKFRFDTNVSSADRETPFALAKRLNKPQMCLILEPDTREGADSIEVRPLLPVTTTTTTTDSASSHLPYPKTDQFPVADLRNTSLIINETGNYVLENKSFFSITQIGIMPLDQQIQPTTVHVQQTEENDSQYQTTNPVQDDTRTPIVHVEQPIENDKQYLTINPDEDGVTPITPTTKSQILRNLTCPVTGRIMQDPVIASDGQTYERKAIVEYVNRHHCSPTTGTPMDATVKDNTELQKILQSLRELNILR
jgi:hypothetical protein